MEDLIFALGQSWAYFRALRARDYETYSHLDGTAPVAFSGHQIEVMNSQIADAREVEHVAGDLRASWASQAMKDEAIAELRMTTQEITNALSEAARSMSCITGDPFLEGK